MTELAELVVKIAGPYDEKPGCLGWFFLSRARVFYNARPEFYFSGKLTPQSSFGMKRYSYPANAPPSRQEFLSELERNIKHRLGNGIETDKMGIPKESIKVRIEFE